MAEGIDTSAYPPMGPELVAPAVGWLAHESCSVTGEMFVALAGRVAAPPSPNRPACTDPSWTIEDVAEHIGAIRDMSEPVDVPGGARRARRPHPLQLRDGQRRADDMPEPAQGPLARSPRRRPHRDGDGPLLHPDHGRHGRRRDQGRAAAGRQHPLHLGRARAGDERGVRQRQPRQAQRRARPAATRRARRRCAR